MQLAQSIVICASCSESVATYTALVRVEKVTVHWKKKTLLFNIFDMSHEEIEGCKLRVSRLTS